jgi:ABC-type multidrug transport system fused ATPase/permease subunit
MSTKKLIRLFWSLADVRPIDLIVPAVLVLVGSAFEGLSYGLLIPLTRAISDGGFGFLSSSRVFGWIARLVPGAPSDRTLVVLILSFVVLGRFGFLVAEYLREVWVAARGERYRMRVRAGTFSRVLGFGRLYFSRRALGELDAEVEWAGHAPTLLALAENAYQSGLRLLVKLGVMVALSPWLTATFFLTVPITVWLMKRVEDYVNRVGERTAEIDRRMRREVLELLSSMPLVKAFSQEDAAARRHADILAEARGLAVRRARVVELRWPISEVVFLGTMLLVEGTQILLSDSFTPGDLSLFAAFLLLLQQGFPDVSRVSNIGVVLADLLPRLHAVGRLFEEGDKHAVTSGDVPFDRLEREIHVRHLSFEYTPGVPVLRDASAIIPAGAVTAIVGESGSGKTTFVDLIARLYECPPDTILFDGRDVRELSLESVHRRMALVSQENWLVNRSLRENLCFGIANPPSDAAIVELLEDLALGELLERLPEGLDTEVGDRGVRLSGGQRQRIDIARAILHRPDIVIMDEATSALDSLIERRVLRTVQERLAGSTVILIAHRLSTVRTADFILVLDKGRVVESGRWGELLQREGTFYELHRAQSGPRAINLG